MKKPTKKLPIIINPTGKPIRRDEKGAAATLRRWEDQEQAEAIEVQGIMQKLSVVRKLKETDDNKSKIQSLEWQLDSARKRWQDTSKLLLSFEKGVAPEKREGEKLGIAVVETLLENCWRADRLAVESFGLSIAQDAIRCGSEQEFYTKFQETFRKTRENALRDGILNQHFPELVLRAFEASL